MPDGRRRHHSRRSAFSHRPSNPCRFNPRHSRSNHHRRARRTRASSTKSESCSKSKSLLGPLKSPGETMDDFNASAKGAGESLSNIAKPSIMVSGRAACLVAANGAPNCKAGDRLCQSKGYKEGKTSTPMQPRNARRKCTCRAASASRGTARQKITSPGLSAKSRPLTGPAGADDGSTRKPTHASVKTQYLTLERLP